MPEQNMKICIARLREKTRFVVPLRHILDSFYVLLSRFMVHHPEHKFSFYNISFNGSDPIRNPFAVKRADCVIIPTEQEFHYHIPGYFHTKQMARSAEFVDQLRPYIKNKKVILLRSDRADDEILYKQFTFKGIDFDCRIIDEIDFPYGIHGMKYHFIQEQLGNSGGFGLFKPPENKNKEHDFCYWGSLKNKVAGGGKSDDRRHIILKDISKTKLKSFWIGRYTNIEPNVKMSPMIDILPHLTNSKATLCFNWLDSKATTSRYHEAMAVGMIPFVWNDYDSSGMLVKDEWQRIKSVSELEERILSLKRGTKFRSKFEQIKESYHPPSIKEYYTLFDTLLLSQLKD